MIFYSTGKSVQNAILWKDCDSDSTLLNLHIFKYASIWDDHPLNCSILVSIPSDWYTMIFIKLSLRAPEPMFLDFAIQLQCSVLVCGLENPKKKDGPSDSSCWLSLEVVDSPICLSHLS